MGKEINPIKSNATLKRQKFSKDFKLNAVKLLKAGQTPATQLAVPCSTGKANHGAEHEWQKDGL